MAADVLHIGLGNWNAGSLDRWMYEGGDSGENLKEEWGVLESCQQECY